MGTTVATVNGTITARFDADRFAVYAPNSRRRTAGTKVRGATVVQYMTKTSKAPNGEGYVARYVTINLDGRRWFGQVRKDGSVTLRPRAAR